MKLGLIIASISLAGSTVTADDSPTPVRLPIARDTWFSNVGGEADTNTGGSPRLKLKSIQEMSLIDVDPSPIRGRVVRSATLHVRSTGEPRLKRITVGSFGSEWFEGTAPSYEPQAGSSTHNHKRHPDVPWTIPGSDLCSVMLGQGGTTWRMADASPPDRDGWQTVPVAPKVIAARVVMSHREDETDAEADREASADTIVAAGKAAPRRVSPRRSLSHARANRLRTVPAGHRRRCAASSGVRPSK